MFLSLIFAVWLNPAFAGNVIEKIVAIVNDDIVLQSDLSKAIDEIKKGTIVDDLLVEDPKELLKSKDKLIEHLVNEKVIEGEIKKRNLQVKFEQVEKEITKISGRNQITRAQLKEALKAEGTSFSDYQEFIRRRLERQALIEQSVTSKIRISDEEIVAHYLANRPANKGSVKNSYEYKLAHIIFVHEGNISASAQKKAERIIERIQAGESFESLASKYSEDPNFSSGGLLGTFKTGEFLPELEGAVRNVEPGQISKPVTTKAGVHVVKVLDKKIIPDPKIEAEKERIRQVLYQQAFKRQFAFWLDQRKRDSFIRIN